MTDRRTMVKTPGWRAWAVTGQIVGHWDSHAQSQVARVVERAICAAIKADRAQRQKKAVPK